MILSDSQWFLMIPSDSQLTITVTLLILVVALHPGFILFSFFLINSYFNYLLLDLILDLFELVSPFSRFIHLEQNKTSAISRKSPFNPSCEVFHRPRQDSFTAWTVTENCKSKTKVKMRTLRIFKMHQTETSAATKQSKYNKCTS